MRVVLAGGYAARARVPRHRSRSPPAGAEQPAGRVSDCAPRQERAAIARDMFAHFGRLLTVLLKFSTLSPRADDGARGVPGRGSGRGRARAGRGRAAASPATSASGRSTRWCTRSSCSRWRVLARPLDNPLLHDLLERVRGRTGNSVIYRRGAIRRVLRALAANQAVALLIDQHIQTGRRRLRRVLQQAGGDDVGAGRARAAHRRAGHSGLRAAAARRTLPDGLRARGRAAARRTIRRRLREFTQRCTDVLEMYVRRYPAALAVDAPPVAGRPNRRPA